MCFFLEQVTQYLLWAWLESFYTCGLDRNCDNLEMMSKKAFVVILVLSVVVTIGIAFIGFITKNYQVMSGWPFRFTGFSFLGSTTNYTALLLDIAFWFVIIWVIWKVLQKITAKG